jgi:uncharacterized membrane protein
MKRIYSIDFTRGLVMILMVLDHVRDLMHVSSITRNPVDLSSTTSMIFFTRIITYLCAPIFVFLAGTSAYISFNNRKNPAESRKNLFKRGSWLILLEFTLVNFGVWFDLGFHTWIFQVIAAIGLGFIILSFMLMLSPATIGITGLTILFGHNLLSFLPLEGFPILKAILSPLFVTTAFPLTSQITFVMGYPPVPWLGIMLVGFASGKLFELPDHLRKNTFLKIGLGALILFAVLRFINIYGDPSLWSFQKNSLFTFLSFINVTKYPPSLLFSLVTLGIMFIILSLADQAKNNFTNFVSVYGKVPLFFYLIHWYIVHPLLIAIMFFQGFSWTEMDFASGNFGRPKGTESGLELWAIYLIWLGVILILYYPCRKYSTYKAAQNKWWLKYI